MNYSKPDIAVLGDAGQVIQGSKSVPWEIVNQLLVAPHFELED